MTPLRLFIAMICLTLMSSAAFADVINVPADYPTIQDAIDASSNGDEIIVAPGTYTSTQDGHVVDMKGKAVTLRASGGPEVTIIDGEYARRGIACFNDETDATVIEGFTITNGNATWYDYDGDGSEEFWEDDGGGIFCYQSGPTITGCTISGNTTESAGGGIYCLANNNPSITDCTISGNEAFWGGGIYCQLNITITGCEISGNKANYTGGGIYCANNTNPTITGCTISDNTASGDHGGGIYHWSFDDGSTLADTTVCGNAPDQIYGYWESDGGNTVTTVCPSVINVPEDYALIQDAINVSSNGDVIQVAAGTYYEHSLDPNGKAITIQGTLNSDGSLATTIDAQQGGGVFVINNGEGSGTVIQNIVITGGVAFGSFPNNSGGGIYCNNSSPTINGCTISGNSAKFGGGISCSDNSNPIIIDCTISGNSATAGQGGGIYCFQSSNPTISGCTISGNTASYSGGGIACEFSGNATITDCTISGNEAVSGGGISCINSYPTITGCTITGNTAGKYGGGIYNSSSSNSFLSDTTVCCNDPDQIVGEWTDSGGNYVADGCIDDCNCNQVSDLDDVGNGTSYDCNQNLVPDECEEDCDGDGIIDDCDNDPDLDGDGIPDNCEPDCNGNTIPDDFEIEQGWTSDCDEDEVPDECQLADGSQTDCDEDGLLDVCQINDDPDLDCDTDSVLDACAIDDGLVEDCNDNDIPDSCDIDNGGDADGDGYLDECECREDISGPDGPGIPDGVVDVNDVLAIIGYWGQDQPAGDVDGDGIVGVNDMLAVLEGWGPCP